MKIYITASGPWSALYWKSVLEANGHFITSDWHNRNMHRTEEYNEIYKVMLADDAQRLILASDALLIISDPDKVPGGKFVHAGIAIGANKKVFLVGRRENLAMYSSSVLAYANVDELIKGLTHAEPQGTRLAG